VEILDSYNEMKLVALIEVVSPTNKEEKCKPRLSSQNRLWADERIAAFRATRPDALGK